MANTKRGIAPPDPATPVGQFRLLAGDSEYEPYDPPEPGYGLYAIWSDDEIEAFLTITDGNIARAIALAYTQLAAAWNSSSATIRTDDLQYSVKDSVGSWLNLAAYWNRIADEEEARAVDDYFDMVDVGTVRRGCRRPEASPPYFCGCRGGCNHW